MKILIDSDINAQVRKADLKDVKAILDIEMKCFDSHQFNKNQFEYYIKNKKSIFFVIYITETCGYISGIIDERGEKRKARLYSMAVLSEYGKLDGNFS